MFVVLNKVFNILLYPKKVLNILFPGQFESNSFQAYGPNIKFQVLGFMRWARLSLSHNLPALALTGVVFLGPWARQIRISWLDSFMGRTYICYECLKAWYGLARIFSTEVDAFKWARLDLTMDGLGLKFGSALGLSPCGP